MQNISKIFLKYLENNPPGDTDSGWELVRRSVGHLARQLFHPKPGQSGTTPRPEWLFNGKQKTLLVLSSYKTFGFLET